MSKSTNYLQDNSWIKKQVYEEEDVDRDPNFGKSILGHIDGTSPTSGNSDEPIIRNMSTSVRALSKRFSPDGPSSSTSTTTVSMDGKTMTTTQTTIKNVRTETFRERVLSSSKGGQYSAYTPPKTTEVTRTSITSPNDAEDHLYNSLTPSSTKGSYSPTDSRSSIITTETVTVKSSSDAEAEDQLYDRLIPKTIQDEAASVRTPSSSTETVTLRTSIIGIDDDRYKSLPSDSSYRRDQSTVTSSSTIRRYSSYTDDSATTNSSSYTISTKPGDDYSSDKTYSYSRPSSSYEYSSGPSSYSTTTYTTIRSEDNLSDPLSSKSSIKNVYSSSDRSVLDKDLCTTCHKPFTGDAKMILEDMNINCHATCFSCDVCRTTMGNLKAGDSLWVYRGMVHCERCFESTKAKWRG